jgi:hypothetical protein
MQALKSIWSQYTPFARLVLGALVVVALFSFFVTKLISKAYFSSQYKQFAITAQKSFITPKALPAQDMQLVPTGINTAAFVIVKNPNLDLALISGIAEMEFFNAEGSTVAKLTQPLHLLPNGQRYLVVGRVEALEKVTRGEVVYTNLQWAKRFRIPEVSIFQGPATFYTEENPTAFVVQGNITNRSAYYLGKTTSVILVRDANNKVLAISVREERDVKPGQTRVILQRWTGQNFAGATKAEIITETNTLDIHNLGFGGTALPAEAGE